MTTRRAVTRAATRAARRPPQSTGARPRPAAAPARPTRPAARAGGAAAARKPRAPGPAGARAMAEYGRTVLAAEAAAIGRVVLGDPFARAVEWILGCTGRVVVTGMGKPGFVAQKISATLASTGTSSYFIHPAEAAHGDLGRVSRDDVVIALSNSGETEEILRLLPALKKIGARIVSITRDTVNPLARGSHLAIAIGNVEEACPMGLAPTASTAVLLAVGDALAMTVLENRDFSREEYALYHPGGKLGRGLMKVRELMRQGEACPVVAESAPLSAAVAVMTVTPGRPGATGVHDAAGKLVGIFTDGDLRRLVEHGQTDFTRPIATAMGRNPRTIRPEDLVVDAARVLRQARIDQVPVVDGEGRMVGLLDVQDLLAAKII
ncbi:MAG: KpsF/GutQ family sugar-phosphate isomerase [Anaeromyxobacter sp.]|nr:KpsF/GutQ family sugar-phosphate isomerase [Anaeromyxobacter sp.]MBL0275481.1 KpsF/GutQ family sugar-phosphate isomerase [Anaeromyxobacter sp.]